MLFALLVVGGVTSVHLLTTAMDARASSESIYLVVVVSRLRDNLPGREGGTVAAPPATAAVSEWTSSAAVD